MDATIEKKVNSLAINLIFIDKKFLTYEQLTDPDYRLKLLQNLDGQKYPITCSRYHHCR